jgi:hypothetical protein
MPDAPDMAADMVPAAADISSGPQNNAIASSRLMDRDIKSLFFTFFCACLPMILDYNTALVLLQGNKIPGNKLVIIFDASRLLRTWISRLAGHKNTA